MRPPRAEFVRAEDLAVGLCGAGLLLMVELVALAPAAALLRAGWVVAGLFAGLGLVIALGLSVGRYLAERASTRRWALVAWSVPAVFVLLPVSRSLFQGAFASTLPGAQWGVLWVPVVGVALIAVTLHFAALVMRTPLGRGALGAALPVLAIELDLLNRYFLASEYPDLHTLGLVVSALLAGLGLRLVVERFAPLSLRWPLDEAGPWLRGVTVACLLLLSAALVFGLSDKASRRSLADHGMHGRLLDRVAKSIADLDGDGHAMVLGGGECNELDAEIHPDARDVVKNGIDEDCDGEDLLTPWALPGDAARRKRVAEWRAEPRVDAIARRVSRSNVLLFVVDALRADPFEVKPENQRAYPNFFELRRRGHWFNRAFSPAAGTDLSMTGVLTGKPNPMSGSDATLPETFAAAGYRSHAVIPAEVMRFASPTMLTRGFERHDVVDPGQRSAPGAEGLDSRRITDLGLSFIDRWSRNPDRPFFLWLHYFDVHEHHEIAAESPPLIAANGGKAPRSRSEKYRALVRVVDGALGRVLADLKSRGLEENTIIVLLSDHGESLGEDPRLPEKHGRFLYNPLVHVPLAVVVPGLRPEEVNHPVSLLDVPATLLDLLGAPPGPESPDFQGESLLPLLLDGPGALFQPPRILPLHESDQFGLIAWPHKLLYRPAANLTELYDLSRDFGERQDQAEASPELVRSLLNAYRAFPAVALDRTTEGRRRWEMKARATRLSKKELSALAARLPTATVGAAVNDWRPAAPARARGVEITPLGRGRGGTRTAIKASAATATTMVPAPAGKVKRPRPVRPARSAAVSPATAGAKTAKGAKGAKGTKSRPTATPASKPARAPAPTPPTAPEKSSRAR